MKKPDLLIDDKTRAIYEEFRSDLGIHAKDITNAQNLHSDLLDKSPFRYESPFLISAVCVYAISNKIPQKITLDDIENICHIKKQDILKCYKLVLESDSLDSLQTDDDMLH